VLNSSGWFIPNGLGYLDNPGPVPLSLLMDGQFRPSTGWTFETREGERGEKC
jgi:hypothetical protein